jgi:hypothetical protein
LNRRLVALLVVLAISLQGPSLAYAAAKTMPASCAGHVLGQSGSDDSCCPQGMLPGVCCAGGLVLTGMASAPVTLPAMPLHLLPFPSGSSRFTTERSDLPSPEFALDRMS